MGKVQSHNQTVATSPHLSQINLLVSRYLMVLYFTKWKGENKDDNLIKLESLRGTMVKDFNNFCRIEVILAYKSCTETKGSHQTKDLPYKYHRL